MRKFNFLGSKWFQLTIVASVLFLVITSATKLTYDSYYGFYYYKKKHTPNALYSFMSKVNNLFLVRFLGSYTGFETGYGFFGPNVSSDFVLLYEVKDEKGLKIKSQKFELESKEGNLRFTSINRLFLDRITHPENEKNSQYSDIILQQIHQQIVKKQPKNHSVKLQLYLYHYPSIEEYKAKKSPSLYLIKEIM